MTGRSNACLWTACSKEVCAAAPLIALIVFNGAGHVMLVCVMREARYMNKSLGITPCMSLLVATVGHHIVLEPTRLNHTIPRYNTGRNLVYSAPTSAGKAMACIAYLTVCLCFKSPIVHW